MNSRGIPQGIVVSHWRHVVSSVFSSCVIVTASGSSRSVTSYVVIAYCQLQDVVQTGVICILSFLMLSS